jgi:hypothetical protein
MDAGRLVDAVRSGHNHPVVAASAPVEKEEMPAGSPAAENAPTETVKPKAKKRGKK